MITDALFQAGGGAFVTVCGWFPKVPAVDQVVVSAGGYLGPILNGAASLGCWVPWAVIGTCMVVVGPLFLATLAFKTLRALFSYVPLIGGAG